MQDLNGKDGTRHLQRSLASAVYLSTIRELQMWTSCNPVFCCVIDPSRPNQGRPIRQGAPLHPTTMRLCERPKTFQLVWVSPFFQDHRIGFLPSLTTHISVELFADFGDDWDGNFTDDFYQDKFTRYDYMLADEIIRELVGLYKDFSNLTLDFQEDILDFVLGRMLSAAAGKHAKTIKSLIPENPRKLQKVLDAGGTFMYRYPDMIQSTKWLSSHGYCLDTLQMGPSTIPHAGRGAFATRSFQRGDIVTLTPMMHIADKSVLEIYDLETIQDPDTGSVVRVNNYEAGLSGYQLLMNYCFGHSESSLLLFPLGSHAGLINHDKSPNAYITWSRVADNNLPNQHAFQDVSVDAMAEVNRIVVVMKIVAIRPIEEGEEVTIDYGDEWVSAWEDYMRDWEYYAAPHPHPLQPDDLRDQYRNKPLKIPAEILADPYPANVATACYLSTREREDGLPQHDGVIEITQWDPPDDGRLFVGTRLFVADIMERQKTGNAFFYNYTVLARAEGKQGFQKVVNVPHEVCVFVNKPYTSDIHTDGAFRHPIGIRDDRFPQAWRNLR